MMPNEITFAAVGDSLTISRVCHHSPHMLEIQKHLTGCDISITNIEAAIHDFEDNIYPSRVSGGDWVAARPEILTDLNWLGFNLYSMPNNHSFDWMCNGISKTIEHLKNAQAAFSGIGNNLYEASRPVYYETPWGRIALISMTTTYEEWHRAGRQRHDMAGRPGVNAVGFQTVFSITEDEQNILKQIANRNHIEFGQNEGLIQFDRLFFQTGGNEPKTQAALNDKRLLGSVISQASRQADLVVISCHSHESKNGKPHINADFQVELARFCIDCGARAYISHGPHVLRGIEVYKDSPIFYSLGNFFYQCELIEREPEEFYSKFKAFDYEACTCDVFDYRIEAGGLLGETNPDYFQSVIAKFKLYNKKLSYIELVPLSLNYGMHRSLKGTPQIAKKEEAQAILSRIRELSAPYGTKMSLLNETGRIEL